jgi:single-stranded DNA-specific DHH superfamily exonuclease
MSDNYKATDIAKDTLRKLYKTIDWQIADNNTEGDEHYAIQRDIANEVISLMYKEIKK